MKTLRLFATRGFDEVTIDAISIESGCSHGLIYHYFEKKDDIFNALLKIQEAEYPESVFPKQTALEVGGLFGLKVACDFFDNLKNACKNALFFAKINVSRDYSTYSAVKKLLGESPYKPLVTLIKEAQANGDIPKSNPETKALAFLDYAMGVLSRLISGEGKQSAIEPGSFFEFVSR